jgi:iron-sulfur cluster repair protein YtfE (RIC family)
MTTTEILPIPPTATLKAVHDRMKELFARYNTLGPEAGWAKTGLYQVIQEVLHRHMEIEETLFYPTVQGIASGPAIAVVLKALKDHQQAKALLEELKVLSSENKPLDSKMSELQECVVTHLQLEEGEIFPHARSMPPEALSKLSAEMEKLRERLRGNSERPSPDA